MLSIDTNILLYALNADSPDHHAAYRWLSQIKTRRDIAISEFILVELYLLLRNRVVLKRPLTATEATNVIQIYRRHPYWQIIGFPGSSEHLHDQLWHEASRDAFAFRRIIDLRTALTLVASGVDEFATVNLKDFAGTGFKKVWNPLASS